MPRELRRLDRRLHVLGHELVEDGVDRAAVDRGRHGGAHDPALLREADDADEARRGRLEDDVGQRVAEVDAAVATYTGRARVSLCLERSGGGRGAVAGVVADDEAVGRADEALDPRVRAVLLEDAAAGLERDPVRVVVGDEAVRPRRHADVARVLRVARAVAPILAHLHRQHRRWRLVVAAAVAVAAAAAVGDRDERLLRHPARRIFEPDADLGATHNHLLDDPHPRPAGDVSHLRARQLRAFP